MKHILAVTALAFAIFATGCASTSDIDEVKAMAQQAQSDAQQANDAAAKAQSTADQALQAAKDAQASADEANEKVDRAFKKSMEK